MAMTSFISGSFFQSYPALPSILNAYVQCLWTRNSQDATIVMIKHFRALHCLKQKDFTELYVFTVRCGGAANRAPGADSDLREVTGHPLRLGSRCGPMSDTAPWAYLLAFLCTERSGARTLLKMK